MPASTERRTQLYLTAAQHRAVTALARRSGTSLAAVVREALTRHLAAAESAAGADWDGDPTLALVGALRLPPLAGADINDAMDGRVYASPN